MHEDEMYKSSTQYRYWSFSSEKLASLRESTNSLAAARVRAAVSRSRENATAKDTPASTSGTTSETEGNGGGNVTPARPVDASDIDCLTVEEERVLVDFYCVQALEDVSKSLRFPIEVTATAIQLMKRFYLFNSPMTYKPKDIMLTALFFVTKSEPFYVPLSKFVSTVAAHGKKGSITEETILAPEFIFTQGVRFMFDVKHPFRAIKGIEMELMAMAQGTAITPEFEKRTASQLQQELRVLKTSSGGTAPVAKRIVNSCAGAKQVYLQQSALLTDAYFLYTPSQICFASLLLIDEPLTIFYLSTKFSAPADRMRIKVLATIKQCAALLKEGQAMDRMDMAEPTRISKKLYQCQNPEKKDLVSLNQAAKRGEDDSGKSDENKAKKRKLEREQSMKEGDDLFGPVLGANGDKQGG